jgi:hypothetical protein
VTGLADRQNLIESIWREGTISLKSDQLLVGQPVPCHLELLKVQSHEIADLLFAIETDTVLVCCQDQEHIQNDILVGHGLEIPVSQQAMIDPGKGAGDLAYVLGLWNVGFWHSLLHAMGSGPVANACQPLWKVCRANRFSPLPLPPIASR